MTQAPAERPIELLLADDHELFREGLVALLERDNRIQVSGQAATAEEAVDKTRSLQPNLLLLDVEMPGGNVRSTLARIRRQAPETIVLILTMHNDEVLKHDLLAAGASGYLVKTLSANDLVKAIHDHVNRRDNPPRVGTRQNGRRHANLLSPRELSVLSLIAIALPNQAIAEELSIAVGTVRRHVHNIFQKLGATSRIDAVRRAQTLGVLHDKL